MLEPITQLALELPPELLTRVAEVIAAGDWREGATMRRQTLEAVPEGRFRAAVRQFLTAWEPDPEFSPAAVALALRAAGDAAQQQRQAQSVDLIWTGPGVLEVPLRRTDQALLEVIQAAEQELLIVSFAVYKIPAITAALIQAYERGVRLRICVETPEPSGQRTAYNTLQALGREVQQRAAIYLWPRDQRPQSTQGKTGSLHAKCAVADEHLLFISSANLTEYAMQLNMEMGVLIRGGTLPGMVTRHFTRLMEEGVLRRVLADSRAHG